MTRRYGWLLAVAALAFIALALVSCGDSATPPAAPTPVPAAATPAVRAPAEILGEALTDAYRSRDTYQAAIARFGDNTPFANIAQSEDAHVAAWKREFERLGIAAPADTFSSPASVAGSFQLACAAGVTTERASAALFDRLERETTDAGLLVLIRQQRTDTLENHLVAFERCD